jgi:hypothetical protein
VFEQQNGFTRIVSLKAVIIVTVAGASPGNARSIAQD